MCKTCFCIVVVSDSVYEGIREDVSGRLAQELLIEKGYSVRRHYVVPNSYREIHRVLLEAVRECDVVVVVGGTGVSPRDISVDVVKELSWRHIPGYGELFRLLTYQREGYKSVYTRAEAYIVGDSIVYTTPGSPKAVEQALEIIVNTVDHLVEELHRYKGIHREPKSG